eukprot:6148-Prorocentrum_minimum.AAC.1
MASLISSTSLLASSRLRNLKPQNSTILLASSRLRWLPSSRLVLRVLPFSTSTHPAGWDPCTHRSPIGPGTTSVSNWATGAAPVSHWGTGAPRVRDWATGAPRVSRRAYIQNLREAFIRERHAAPSSRNPPCVDGVDNGTGLFASPPNRRVCRFNATCHLGFASLAEGKGRWEVGGPAGHCCALCPLGPPLCPACTAACPESLF